MQKVLLALKSEREARNPLIVCDYMTQLIVVGLALRVAIHVCFHALHTPLAPVIIILCIVYVCSAKLDAAVAELAHPIHELVGNVAGSVLSE